MRKSILLILAILLFSCERNEDKSNLVFSLIQPNDINPMYEAFLNGCKEAVAENKLSDKYDIIIDKSFPAEEDSTLFEDITLDMVNTANFHLIAGLMINPINSNKLNNIINQGALSGTSIFTFGSDAPNSLRYAYFGPDNYDLGKQMGIKAVEAINENGTVAILAGSETDDAQQERVRGAIEKVTEELFLNVKLAENGVIYTNGTSEDSKEKFIQFNSENQIDVWIILSSSLYLSEDIFPINHGTVKIVACEGIPRQLELMDQGYIDYILAYDYFELGKMMLNSIIDLTQYDIEPEDKNYIPLTVINKYNTNEIDIWLENWNKWLK